MTTRRSATKKSATRKSAKKKPTRSRKKKSNGAQEPIEGKLCGESKYKVKAAQLELDAATQRIEQQIAADIQRIRDRARRNDPAWKKANAARTDAINEFLDTEEKRLPDGFAIVNVNALDGTYKALHDPEQVGKRL